MQDDPGVGLDRGAERVGDLLRLVVECEGLARREGPRRLLGGPQQIPERFPGHPRAPEVDSEDPVVLGKAVGVELLDRKRDSLVQRLAALQQQRRVRHLLREHVLERVSDFRE